jgi:hypothetical protein
MSESATIPIRSFRVCFRFERRIHKIDRWRIPLPFGVPLRGVGYAVALLIGVLLVQRTPVIGALFGSMPVPMRLVLLPIGAAYVLLQWEPDGRPAHALALGWLRMQVLPARLIAFRAAAAPQVVALGRVTVVPDESSARLRPAVVSGPAELVLRYPFDTTSRGRTLHIAGQDGPPRWRGKQIRLRAGQRAVIR